MLNQDNILTTILLATYNGESYIESQILSILGQSFKNWRLLIHDDGSTDNTLSIIKKWSDIDKRINLIEDHIVCGGAADNFMHLLQYATSEYAMFCDQDDIWFDNKIEVMLKAIQKKDPCLPQVVYSNSYVWQPQEGIKGLATLSFPSDLKHFLFNNSGHQGCASLFNREMIKILLEWKGTCAMHDHLLQLSALVFGSIEYLHTPLMLYRNHKYNVTGSTDTSLYNFTQLINNSQIPVVSTSHYETIRLFKNLFFEKIPQPELALIETYLKLKNLPNRKRFFIIFATGFKLHNSRIRLLFKLFLRNYSN